MKTQKNTFENFPKWVIEKWQDIVDILAESIGVPAALVMRTEDEFREVFISSQSENNPYHVGDKEKWHGLYCETVIKTQNKLLVPNANKDANWDKNPDIKLGMIAYLGIPLCFRDNQTFGTLCILDNKDNKFTKLHEKLILQFKNVMELDLALIQSSDIKTNELANTLKEQQSQLSAKNIELQKAKEKAEENKERYKMVLNAAMFPIIISTFNGKVVFINQAAEDFFGVSFDEIDNLSSADFWAIPSQRNEFISQLKENGVVNNIEIEYRTKKNGIRDTVMSSTIIDYDENKAILSILNDITDRKNAEQALRLSEDKFAKAFNISPDAITLTDIETSEIIDANAGFERVYGYAVNDVIGKTALELDVWADLTSLTELIKILNRDGIVLDFDASGRRKSGELIHVLVSGSIITVGVKKILVLTARDITERKKAEEVLRQSEARLNAIISSMNDIIFEIDLNNCFQGYFAPNNKSLYVQPDFFIGKKFDEILPEDVCAHLRQAIESINSGNPYQQFEYHLTVDNLIEWEHAVITPRYSISNELVGVTVACRNITERKKAEENLMESQRKLATLMGNLPGLAFRCMNNKDWTMMFISDGCFELTGFYPHELEGNQINSYGKLLHKDDADMVWQKVQEAINNHTFWQVEYRIHTKDGNEKWVWEQGCGVYSTAGELEVLEGFISDISVRKQAETALQKSEARYAFMANNTIDVIWTLSLRTGKFTYVSPSVQKLRGYTPDEVMNQTMAEALMPESLQKVTALIHERLTKRKSGDTSNSTSIYLADQPCKDGSVVSTEVVGNIVFDKDGAPVEVIGVSRDITERKEAEKLLQESEEKYRYLVDNAPIGILQRSIQGDFNFCNLTLAKQFECNSIAEFLLNYNDVTKRWASHEQFVEFNELLLKNGEVLGFENKVKLINGKTKWFSLYFKLDSTKLFLDGFSLDITEQKKAEQAIIESNDYNRQLFSSSKIGLVLAKMTGELVDINQAFADIIGYSIEETLQLSYWEITPEKYAEKEQEQLKSLNENGFYGPYEKEYIHKNGVLVPVVLSGNIIERSGEKYIWSSVGDITERKKHEANLIKLYTAINSSKASIVITDIDGNIEFANPYFTELTSFSEGEYLGKTPRVLKSGIHSDEYYKALWDTINSGKTWEGEFCNRKKNGEFYWEKSIITPIKNEKEEIVNFVAVKSDITTEKKHEHLDDITLEIYEKSEYLSVEEVLKLSIELGIQLTDSKIGFFHFVNEDQETISLQAWSAKTMDMSNVPTFEKHYPITKASVCVDCFYQKKPVYHNDYSSLSHKKGLPEGYATLSRDLAVPVIVENKIVAIFGVGNKESDYTEIDAEFLSIFAENVWNVIRRKKSEFELIESKEQIQRFASHLQNVREEEKISIAREIHDDLGQILVALQIDMGLLKNKVIKTIPSADSLEILPKFDNIVDLIKRSIKSARSIMNGLRPELLELRGLVGAVNEYLREFEERYHISCELNDDVVDIEMTTEQSLALFRILQETMNNIVKHAKATLIKIHLHNLENKVVLQITDNGVGFDKNNSGRNDSYGMIGMKERVVLLKGELDITSEIGHGTTVRVEIPF